MDKVVLTTKLSVEDYIKVSLHTLYGKLAIKVMFGIGCFMLLMVVVLLFKDGFTLFFWLRLLFGLLLTVGLPAQVYFAARRGYKANPRINETIKYEFDRDYVQIIGESFDSKLTWDKMYSVTENKDFVLLWPNKQMVNVLPKRDFKSNELRAFKEMVKSLPKLENKLK